MNRCCKKKKNRVLLPSVRADIIIEECKKCGCKHRRLMVEPGVIGIVGKDLGR